MWEGKCISKLSAMYPGGSAKHWLEGFYYKLNTYLCLRCFFINIFSGAFMLFPIHLWIS